MVIRTVTGDRFDKQNNIYGRLRRILVHFFAVTISTT